MLNKLKYLFTILPALAGMVFCAPPARASMEDYPKVLLKGLDKSTARTTTLEAKVGETFRYGPLHIRIQSCRKSPPIEAPESAAFIQIWEVPPETQKSQWVFSGWMFASSPALSAMDHPVYDIWVMDCAGKEPEIPPQKETEEKTEPETTETPAEEANEETQDNPPSPASENEAENSQED